MSEKENIPDWIKEQNREKAREKQKADEISQRQLEAAKILQQKGRAFWEQFVDRLRINVKALPDLEGEELAGSVSGSGESAGELICYVQVDRRSVKYGPELSRMNLFYRPGGSRIRRWYQDKEMSDIELVTRDNEVCAMNDDIGPLTAAELADQIVELMAENVKAKLD